MSISFNVLGVTTLIEEETPNKTEDEVPQWMEPGGNRDSEEKQSKVPTQTHWISNRQLSKGPQSAQQEWTAKENDEVITEKQPSSTTSTCMCAFLKQYLKAT